MYTTLRKHTLYLAVFIAGAFCSCSNTKHLPEGDSLYVGARVNIKDEIGDKKYRKVLKRDLDAATRPKPNSKLLGMRVKLSIYNLARDTSKGGFFRNLLRKFGEPPVLTSTLDLTKNNELFVNLMENRGYFFPKVESHKTTEKRKTTAHYDVWTGPLYRIRNVDFPIDSSQISIDVSSVKDKTLLKSGEPFNLGLIKGERDRIDKVLNDRGYYYFKPDYLLVKTDSTVGGHQVDMQVVAKQEEIPVQAHYVYRINDVYVFPNFRLNAQRVDTNKKNATLYKGFHLVDRRNAFKPRVFEQAMQFSPGEVYRRTEQNLSLNRLVSLNTFKFVKNRFEPIDDPDSPQLNVYYYLTPYPFKSIRAEVGVASQNDSRVGTQTSISWRHRNAFKGAELLALTVRAGYEAQAGGAVQRPPTFEGGVQASLSIPRLVVPFFKIIPSSMFIPRTSINAGYDISLRQDLYLIHSIKGSFGYTWKEDIRKEHRFFPININYVRTDTLDKSQEPRFDFSNLIFNGLIIGPSYEYTYNSQAAGLKADNYYFNGLVDLSNNILGAVQGASPEQPRTIFGTEYAQYVKLQADGRYYRKYGIHKNDIWANRIIMGFGYPWGNSSQLPNIKQFFAGGASSLRGFRARLVGPGTFNALAAVDDANVPMYVETLGDVKLEINTEIRKHIYQFLNAALFVDAGNIWTYYDDPRYPGGVFTKNFYKQLAVDAGVGLRMDFNIILLRFDLAFPIRQPWQAEGEEWVLNQVNPGSSAWRQNNLIFNIAIGYPF